MAKMYLMCGCSGAGKTTFSKAFADEHNLKYLGIDYFYALVNGDECIHTNSFEVWIEFYKAIHEAEINNIDVIIDTNAITESHREQFIDWFPTFEHHLIFIGADPKLRNKNNKSRRRQVPDDVMDKMGSKLEIPTTYENFKTITYIFNFNNEFSKPIVLKGETK
jgi:predicted kinase